MSKIQLEASIRRQCDPIEPAMSMHCNQITVLRFQQGFYYIA